MGIMIQKACRTRNEYVGQAVILGKRLVNSRYLPGALAALFGALACGPFLWAQAGPSLVGAIRGRVADQSTGQPLPDALVTLSGGSGVERLVVGADGAFEFTGLPVGNYAVRAERPGYLAANAGEGIPGGAGRPINLSVARPAATLVVSMWKAGAIDGVVTTAGADPSPGAEVHALERTLAGGAWQWADAAVSTADDRGHYHLDNLTPGDFLVVARPVRDPETPLFMALFTANTASAADVMAGVVSSARGTPDLDARVQASTLTYFATSPTGPPAVVTLAAGAARPNVDLHLRPGRGFRVAGTLVGTPVSIHGLTVQLVSPIVANPTRPDAIEQDLEVGRAACTDDGRFAFSDVPPGRYAIVLTWMPPLPTPPPTFTRGRGPMSPPVLPLPTDEALSARQNVEVTTTDLDGLGLDVRRGVRLSGHVAVVDGSTGPPEGLQSIGLRLEPVAADVMPVLPNPPSRVRVDGTGQISSSSLTAGRYILRATAPRGWTVRSAMSGGRDLLDDPIDLHANVGDLVLSVTDHPPGALTGSVASNSQPAAGATVLLFPANPADRRDSSAQARRLRLTRTGDAGGFGIGNLPPGDYLILALASSPPPNWQDPARLATLQKSAVPVTIATGPTPPIALEVVR